MDPTRLAVVYVRVSTRYQVDNYSVQDQRNLAHLAARYGFAAADVREEQGVSAETITARPVMKRVLEEVAQGRVGAIIVASFSRLSRDMDDIDGKIIKKACRDHDCVIITPEKLYDFSTEVDDDLADLQFFFSKIQKRMNLKPLTRGQYTKAKSGGFFGQTLSFGYDYVWKEQPGPRGHKVGADFVINPEEAEIVHLIHNLYPTMTLRSLAAHLNELATQGRCMQYPLRRAADRERRGITHRPWHIGDLQCIIRNDLLIGRMQFAVNARSPYLRGLDPIILHREDLRILPDDIFYTNQHLAEVRRVTAPRTKGHPHLFSGVLRCPHCPGNLIAHQRRTPATATHGRQLIQFYQCRTRVVSGPAICPGYELPQHVALTVVLPILTELIQTNLRDHVLAVSQRDPNQDNAIGQISAELAKIDIATKNLIEAVKAGALPLDHVRAENAELQASRERLNARLAALSQRTAMTDNIRAILDIFDHDLATVLQDLTNDPLRFNTLVRLFFSWLTIKAESPGRRWRAGKKKNEGADWHARIVQYALEPQFAAFVEASGLQLPTALAAITTGIPTDPRVSRVPRPRHATPPSSTTPNHPPSQHRGRVL